MGGAFGGKEVQANPWAAIAALGAWKTRRPVRVRLTRELDMALTGKRHPYLARYRAGFSTRRPLAGAAARAVLRRRLEPRPVRADHVALAVPLRQRLPPAGRRGDRPRLPDAQDVADRVPRLRRTAGACSSSKRSCRRRRSALGLPADVVRERNLYRDGDDTHYGQPVRDAGRIDDDLEQLKTTSRFDDAAPRSRASTPRTRTSKRGLAITPVKFGISFTATFFNQAGALVLVYRDGSVQVNHGGTEMGQGLFTKIQQIAADSLGVPASTRARDADAHRQGAEHVGHRGLGRHAI